MAGRPPVICGFDGRAATPLDEHELAGIRRAMSCYRSHELIARLLATVDSLLPPELGAGDRP